MESRAASRYVKSLLGLAVEKNALEQVHQDMLLFSRTVDQNREFANLLATPIIRHDKKRVILEQLFKGKVHDLTLAFFDIITRKNREPLLAEIAREFHNAYNTFKGIGKATIKSASPLTPELRRDFELMVKNISNKSQVELIEKVDSELIGGFILNIGDRQIDASMKSRLKALDLKFRQNPYIKEI